MTLLVKVHVFEELGLPALSIHYAALRRHSRWWYWTPSEIPPVVTIIPRRQCRIGTATGDVRPTYHDEDEDRSVQR